MRKSEYEMQRTLIFDYDVFFIELQRYKRF